MSRYFDIRPAQSKIVEPKSQKPIIGLNFYVLVILIMGSAFFLSQFLPTSPVANTNLKSNNNINTNTQITPSKSESIISIRIINASDKPENIDRIRELLSSISSSNYTLEQSSSVENRYEQTAIYYKPGQIEAATKLQGIVKTILDPKLEESQTLASTFDFLIIIGQK
jgi:hypothetical protein